MSHDLNNYLTVVAGSADLLGDAPLTPSQRGALEAMDASIRGAVALNQRLVSFVRRKGGGDEGDLGAAVRGCERLLRSVLGAGIALRLELAEAAVRVPLDASAIEQILLNLALNAKDAMPAGGRWSSAHGAPGRRIPCPATSRPRARVRTPGWRSPTRVRG